jgi:UDP-3-O-[3-hydroxymyristoyl] glucosamine N-acyltransferase
MEFTARQIAEIIQGTVEGDENVTVSSVSRIEEGESGTLTFLANPKYEEYLYKTNATIVIVGRDFVPQKAIKESCTLIKVEDAYQSIASLLKVYEGMKKGVKAGIEQPSFIADNVKLGEGVYVGAFAYIGERSVIGNNVKIYPQVYIGEGVTIEDNTILMPGVKVYHDCRIGKNCIIHSGTIIGADGFGFAPNSENNYNKVPQIGNVVIEDFVEVGSNSSIDRATIGSTIIRKGVKLDNLVQVAHNVEIGENTVIAAQSGVAGSTKIGRNCMIGGQVGIIGHLKIADGVKIAAQSGIGQDIKNQDEVVQGSPAFSIGDYRRSYVMFRSLPKIKQSIDGVIKELNLIKDRLNND